MVAEGIGLACFITQKGNMSEYQTEKHPFDFDALKKGDVIYAEQIERLSNTKRSDRAYQLKLLGFREQLQRELESRGMPVTVRIDHDNLIILTDSEAAAYNAAWFNSRKRQLLTCHYRSLQIDTSALDEDERKRHERAIMSQGAQIAAMRQATRVASTTHKRITPGVATGAAE